MTAIKLAQFEEAKGMSSFIFTTTKATELLDDNDKNSNMRVCHDIMMLLRITTPS